MSSRASRSLKQPTVTMSQSRRVAQEKFRPMVFENEMNEEAAAELDQYAHGTPVDYIVEE